MWLAELLHSQVPDSIMIEFGIFQVHWYGLLLVTGIVVGYWLTRSSWRRQGLPLKKLDELIIWLVVAGLLGARLLDVFIYEWWYFQKHLTEIFYIWQGGLAWHGSLLVGVIFLWWWSGREKFSFWQMLDTFAPGLALGQAVGRWGNYFNQELFGVPTSLPWGIPVAEINRPVEFIRANYFHPTFLYESIGLLLIAYLLWQVGKKIKIPGQTFAWYLVLTGLLRFVLEFLRVDEQNIFLGLRAGFWISGLTIILGLWYIHHQPNFKKVLKTAP